MIKRLLGLFKGTIMAIMAISEITQISGLVFALRYEQPLGGVCVGMYKTDVANGKNTEIYISSPGILARVQYYSWRNVTHLAI